jgi:glycosyltransferase involved in cell wall biosynthesis
MRVLMVSKACLVGAYQRKLEEMAAQPDIQLTVAVPAAWRDERGLIRLERAHVQGYNLAVEPIAFNGRFHLHYYPRLGRLMAQVRPQLVHVDEEPYNFATWHALRLARRHGARTLFFSWQNLLRRYPWPFSAFEREVLQTANGAIAGSEEARAVWRAKNFAGPMAVIPQFGVDLEVFRPVARAPVEGRPFVVGYAGRLVRDKGVDLLLRAAAELRPEIHLRIVGGGPEAGVLHRLAEALGLSARVTWRPLVPSVQMPAELAQLDCLVLPSRTRPNWKEQFGRVLIEAMACGVPVIGAESGEIPNVIGEAGWLFPEGDAPALAARLRQLWQQPEARASLGALGRQRAQALYSQRHVAEQTVAFYRDLMNRPGTKINGIANRLGHSQPAA